MTFFSGFNSYYRDNGQGQNSSNSNNNSNSNSNNNNMRTESESLSSSVATVDGRRDLVSVDTRNRSIRDGNEEEEDSLSCSSESSAEIFDLAEIISTLYNYMKISEMDKYGIDVFERKLVTFMSCLDQSSFQTLVTSYWCNAIHFKCIISHRNDKIYGHGNFLRLTLSDSLLDATIQGGSTAQKISCMLLQRRIDVDNVKLSLRQEKSYFVRNCRLRFWNLEVLVQAFNLNGWLFPNLAQIGINEFSHYIYDRAIKMDFAVTRKTNSNNIIHAQDQCNCSMRHFSDEYLTSFFYRYFKTGCNDKNPPATILKKIAQLRRNLRRKAGKVEANFGCCNYLEKGLSETALARWCALVELLSSRGAVVSLNMYSLVPLNYAAQLGRNTWWIIHSPISKKNELLHSVQYPILPKELWKVLSSFL